LVRFPSFPSRTPLVPFQSATLGTSIRRSFSITPPSSGSLGSFLKEGKLLRWAFAVTSYFQLPEQQMKEYELLSHSSIILLDNYFGDDVKKRFSIIAPYHVTHPYRFRDTYMAGPQLQWLDALREEAVIYRLGIHEPITGKMIHEFPLEWKTYKSKTKDLILLHLQDDSGFVNYLGQHQIQLPAAKIDERELKADEEVSVVGHEVKYEGENQLLVPVWTKGKAKSVPVGDGDQVLVGTQEPSPHGMCGGPVLDEHEKVVGSVFGVIVPYVGDADPETHERLQQEELYRMLKGDSLAYTGKTLNKFLRETEYAIRTDHHPGFNYSTWVKLQNQARNSGKQK